MHDDKTGHFEVLDGFPDDVVAALAKGLIDHGAYASELHPMVDAPVADDGKTPSWAYRTGAIMSGLLS